MKTKLKISGVAYNRIINNGNIKHTITLSLIGEIPALGLSLKQISELAQKSAEDKYYKV